MFRFDVRDGGKGTNGGGELRGWDDDDSLAGEDGEDTTRERSLWEAELAAVWEAEADGRGGWWIGEDKAQAELPARW